VAAVVLKVLCRERVVGAARWAGRRTGNRCRCASILVGPSSRQPKSSAEVARRVRVRCGSQAWLGASSGRCELSSVGLAPDFCGDRQAAPPLRTRRLHSPEARPSGPPCQHFRNSKFQINRSRLTVPARHSSQNSPPPSSSTSPVSLPISLPFLPTRLGRHLVSEQNGTGPRTVPPARHFLDLCSLNASATARPALMSTKHLASASCPFSTSASTAATMLGRTTTTPSSSATTISHGLTTTRVPAICIGTSTALTRVKGDCPIVPCALASTCGASRTVKIRGCVFKTKNDRNMAMSGKDG